MNIVIDNLPHLVMYGFAIGESFFNVMYTRVSIGSSLLSVAWVVQIFDKNQIMIADSKMDYNATPPMEEARRLLLMTLGALMQKQIKN